eukprot:SAG11_NODE_6092_length_1390_cov_1.017816_1_plen_121_part_00
MCACPRFNAHVQALPLKSDFAENIPVAEALTGLLNEASTAPFFAALRPQAAAALAGVLALGRAEGEASLQQGALPPPLHDAVLATLRPMAQDAACAQAVSGAAAKMTPDAQAELQKHLQG